MLNTAAPLPSAGDHTASGVESEFAQAYEPNLRFVILANPNGNRIEQFQAALADLQLTPAKIVAWEDLLSHRVRLPDIVQKGDVVRFESPGKDFEVERMFLAMGAEEDDEDDRDGRNYDRLRRRAVEDLKFDKGRILYPRQWFLGFRAALRNVAAQLSECPPHRTMNDSQEIETMFDKCRCHVRLAGAGVVQPQALGSVGSFDELMTRMVDTNCTRAFVKLAHGSSASGVVAFEFNRNGHQQATTTVEMVRDERGSLCLYNSRKINIYREPQEIARLIDVLARHRVHAERWIPKAGIDGRTFDLRVLVVAGRARHVVVRLSRSPLTNLHLLNDRTGSEGVRARMGEQAWNGAMAECERAMTCFPCSLHGGVDLLIAAGFRRHAVLEVNAFGDLLGGALWNGMSPHKSEITALMEGRRESAMARKLAWLRRSCEGGRYFRWD